MGHCFLVKKSVTFLLGLVILAAACSSELTEDSATTQESTNSVETQTTQTNQPTSSTLAPAEDTPTTALEITETASNTEIRSARVAQEYDFGGSVTKDVLAEFFGQPVTRLWGGDSTPNASFVDGGETLRVKYDPFTSGAGLGMGAVFDVVPTQELWCGMDIRIPSNQDFARSGKLGLGIYGGSHPGGGRQAIDGASVRTNWVTTDGKPELSLYVYSPDYFKLGKTYGVTKTSGWIIPTDDWVRIVLGVNLGTAGEANGSIELWAARVGETIERRQLVEEFEFVDANHQFDIDRFQFSTHYGGSGASYSPESTQYRDFKNIGCGPDLASVSWQS